MLGGTSAFSGSGLCVSRQNYEFTGGYNGGTSSLGSKNSTARIARYLKTEYSGTIKKAQNYLENGEFDKAVQKLESLKEYAKDYATEQGYELDDDKMLTILNKSGANFEDYADENAKGSFATGLFNGIPIVGLFFESNSKNEIKSKLNGEEVRISDKIKEGAGKVLSGTAAGLALSCFLPGGPLLYIGGSIIAGFAQNAAKDWLNAH